MACKGTPGELPSPKFLLEQVTQARVQIVLLDPNTPPEYGASFREQPELTVLDLPSTVGAVVSPKSYSDLFDNLVVSLHQAALSLEQRAQR
jgi:hypothetical protein